MVVYSRIQMAPKSQFWRAPWTAHRWLRLRVGATMSSGFLSTRTAGLASMGLPAALRSTKRPSSSTSTQLSQSRECMPFWTSIGLPRNASWPPSRIRCLMRRMPQSFGARSPPPSTTAKVYSSSSSTSPSQGMAMPTHPNGLVGRMAHAAHRAARAMRWQEWNHWSKVSAALGLRT